MDRTYAGTYQCPKHVVMYMPSLRGGGAERVMLSLAAGLAERGLHVDLVLVRAEGEYLHQVPEAVRLVDLDSSRTVASLLKLLRYIRRERPEVILSALTPTNVAALIAKLLFRKSLRVVVREDSTFTEEFDSGSSKERWVLRVLKWLLPRADGMCRYRTVSPMTFAMWFPLPPTRSSRFTIP